MDTREQKKRKHSRASVAILAASVTSVRSTMGFLNQRGIETIFVETLNDAIEAFGTKKANILLLSVNIQHPKLDTLPALMMSSFSVETIAFAEQQGPRSGFKLNTVQTKHIIQGQLTGALVYTKIKLIEKEWGPPPEETSDRIKLSSQIALDIQATHGSGSSTTNVSSQDSVSIQNALSSQPGLNTQDQLSSQTIQGVRSPAQILRDAIRDRKLGISSPKVKPNSTQKPNAANAVPLANAQALGKVHSKNGEKTLSSRDILNPTDETQIGAVSVADTAQVNTAATQNSPKRNDRNKIKTHDTLLKQFLTKALRRVCGDNMISIATISACRYARLMVINTDQIKGSVILAASSDSEDSKKFVDDLEIALFKVISESGYQVNESQRTKITLIDYPPILKTMRISKDTLARYKDRTELAGMVVPNLCEVPKTEAADNQMVRVGVSDLNTDAPLTFDVYLHMPANQKYIRYVKTGSVLEEKQTERLERSRVKSLFFEEKDMEAYKTFFAMDFINEILNTDKNKKAS